MRIARVAVLVVMVCSMLTGCDSCTKKNTTSNIQPAATACSGTTCNTVVYVDAKCDPVNASNVGQDHAAVGKGGTICFFNNGTSEITLAFPSGMIKSPAVPGMPHQEFKVAAGQCVSFQTSSVDSTYGYQISGSACGGPHGNPDVVVGGGSGNGP